MSSGTTLRTALAVAAYAIAMAYLEAAVVVYLSGALGLAPAVVFPLREPALGDLAAIEVGRELATLVMLGAVGWLAGRRPLERLAWAAVAFGVWDILYYAWLAVFIGWPPSLDTWDLLFLVPVPWAGPVWAPMAVSVALVVFGLWAAQRLRGGQPLSVRLWQVLAALGGGVLVVVSFTLDASRIMAGGLPTSFPWPVFVAGMVVAMAAAFSALRPTTGEPGPS